MTCGPEAEGPCADSDARCIRDCIGGSQGKPSPGRQVIRRETREIERERERTEKGHEKGRRIYMRREQRREMRREGEEKDNIMRI